MQKLNIKISGRDAAVYSAGVASYPLLKWVAVTAFRKGAELKQTAEEKLAERAAKKAAKKAA